jgi:hypothetical protein
MKTGFVTATFPSLSSSEPGGTTFHESRLPASERWAPLNQELLRRAAEQLLPLCLEPKYVEASSKPYPLKGQLMPWSGDQIEIVVSGTSIVEKT